MATSVTPRQSNSTPSLADDRHGHRLIAPNTNPANIFDEKAATAKTATHANPPQLTNSCSACNGTDIAMLTKKAGHSTFTTELNPRPDDASTRAAGKAKPAIT